MTATFLVEVDLESVDPQSLSDTVSDMEDALDTVVSLVSIKPWSRPSLSPNIPSFPFPIAPHPSPTVIPTRPSTPPSFPTL